MQRQTNLYRNKHGTYFALIKAGGKQIKKSLRTDDPALAKRRLADLRQKAARLSGAEQKNLRFEELTELWLESIKGELKPSSYRRRVVCVNGLLPVFKGMPVRSIRHDTVDQWKIRRGANLSARSYNVELETLNQLFRYAIEVKRLLLDNPAEYLKRRKQLKPKPVIPNKEQFSALVRELRQSPQAGEAANLVEFLGYSGCRLGEAIQAKWCDVNFQLATLLVTGGELGTKNHEQRTIPLFSPLLTLLQRMRSEQFPSGTPDQSNKTIFNVSHSRQAIHAACKRIGLPRFGHHSMRHFFCSNAIEAGVDFKTIAEWLGHKDGGSLVATTYGHLRAEHSTAMAKRIRFSADAGDTPSGAATSQQKTTEI